MFTFCYLIFYLYLVSFRLGLGLVLIYNQKYVELLVTAF